MFRRFICFLLVPLMLVNQGLCYAHTHKETCIAEQESHTLRPHFHFGDHGHHESTHDREHHADHSHSGHSSHDHSNRDREPDEYDIALPLAFVPIDDHDADAVYCAEEVAVARDGNSVIVLSAKYFVAAAILGVANQNDDWLLRLGPFRGHSASIFAAACPIYLRTLSLRI